ncbi:dna helicase recq family member [Holotrichia oblita]|uniref:Dna helicase recq family member n=1 Tax=Holotrichia oblita TaxID=644536 RepID=A0ACB9T4L7_HOLOL|nr:dna helicase recq family member [Holotrichia oblita]
MDDLSNSFNDDDEKELIDQFKAVDGIEPPHKEHLDVLFKIFGHKEFRPMQWKIISSIINDRRDNCAIMATGYGKSLCYQFPSVYCGGVTIVISPLISLMEDQVLSLTVANIPACLLGTAQTQQKKVIEDIFDNKYSIIYVTPEFCCGEFGRNLLIDMDKKLNVMLVAIDEAHCISSWGHDFRHQYRELSKVRSILPYVPILAVTATATSRVRKDIISSLQLRDPQIIYSGFDRPNLYLSVYLKENNGVIGDLRNAMIKQHGEWVFSGPTIIYCITRKQTEHVADLLQREGIKCLIYHAGLTIKQRKDVHENFVRDKVSVIIATVAFGMGIDKPDVRNVVHYGAARDMESYYQEVGRAGRDGQPSQCTIFYSNADLEILRSLREFGYATEKTKEQKEAMTRFFWKYLETTGCRRQFILQHFEDTSNRNSQPVLKCCDNCTKKLKHTPVEYEEVDSNGLIDLTDYAHMLLTSMNVMGDGFGLNSYIMFLRGSKSSRMSTKFQSHPLHGSGKHKSDNWWKCIARILELEKYFSKQTVKKPTFSYCATYLCEKGKQFLKDVTNESRRAKILVEPPPDLRVLLKKKPYKPTTNSIPYVKTNNVSNIPIEKISRNKTETDVEGDTQKEERMKIYRKLLAKRTDLAFCLDCMPYMIASNEILMNLAQLRPRSVDALKQLKLDGFTEAKINKFGEEFVQVIRQLCPPAERKSIKDILNEFPIDDTKLTPSIEITYSMFKSGKTVEEIADNIFLIVKQRCSDEVTLEEIKAVINYKKIREHIEKYTYDYEEFDPIDTEDDDNTKLAGKTITSTTASEKSTCKNADILEITDNDKIICIEDADDLALNALVDEIETGGYLNGTSTNKCTNDTDTHHPHNFEPPPKKQKYSRSLLDSPPRRVKL